MQKEGKMRKKNQGIHRKPLVIIFKLGHRYEITFSNNRMGEKFGVYGAGEQKKKKKAEKMKLYAKEYEILTLLQKRSMC